MVEEAFATTDRRYDARTRSKRASTLETAMVAVDDAKGCTEDGAGLEKEPSG